jgi:hypothetical protein
LPVHLLAAPGDAEAGGGAQPSDQQARNPGAAVNRTWGGGRLAAAVAAEDDVVGEQLLQPLEIALLGPFAARTGPSDEVLGQARLTLGRRRSPEPPAESLQVPAPASNG